MVLGWKNIRERWQKYDTNVTNTQSVITFFVGSTLRMNILIHICQMFKQLKEKWKVSWFQFILIVSTFTLGGSLCSYLAKQVLQSTPIERGTEYVIIYILLMTILWPICVLVVSIPFGQYPFFRGYLGRIWQKMRKK